MKARWLCLFQAIIREWRWIFQEKRLLLILISIPLIYSSLVAWLYVRKNPIERPAIVVDLDNSGYSRRLVHNLEATQELRIIDRPISIDAGWQAMKSRQAELFLLIPADFSRKIKRAENAEIKLWIDNANMLTFGVAYPAVAAVILDLNRDLGAGDLMRRGIPPTMASSRVLPIVRADRLLFHPTGSYGNFLTYGLFIIVIQQLILIGLAFSTGLARQRGRRDQAERFPFTALEGACIGQSLFYLLGIIVIVRVIFPLFGLPLLDGRSTFWLFSAFSLAMAPLAIIIAGLARDMYSAFELPLFLSTPLLMISGFIWPYDQMPGYIQALAALFPATPALHALRIITLKTIDPSLIRPDLIWLGGQFLFWSSLGIVLIRLRNRFGIRAELLHS
jgi:ABC-2 type transport system permease protein